MVNYVTAGRCTLLDMSWQHLIIMFHSHTLLDHYTKLRNMREVVSFTTPHHNPLFSVSSCSASFGCFVCHFDHQRFRFLFSGGMKRLGSVHTIDTSQLLIFHWCCHSQAKCYMGGCYIWQYSHSLLFHFLSERDDSMEMCHEMFISPPCQTGVRCCHAVVVF